MTGGRFQAVFEAAADRRYLDYSQRPGEVVVDLISYAGAECIDPRSLRRTFAAMRRTHGLRLQVVGGGYQCFRVVLRVLGVPVIDLHACVRRCEDVERQLREAAPALHEQTFVDAEVRGIARSGERHARKVDLRDYATTLNSRRTPESPPVVAVMCALPTPEFSCLKAQLDGSGRLRDKRMFGSHLRYRYSLPSPDGPALDVVGTYLSVMGSPATAAAATQVIDELRPESMILCGIAGSLDEEDAALGDVVVADRVFAYDTRAKENPTGPTFAPTGYQIDRALLTLVQGCSIENDFVAEWRSRASRALAQPHEPRLRWGDVATGGKVVNSPAFREALHQLNRKLLAVEMEAEGFLEACVASQRKCRAMVVRGISDLAVNKERTDADKSAPWRERAATAAAAFVVTFLQREYRLLPRD
jgi:nucleoside phosphorylase